MLYKFFVICVIIILDKINKVHSERTQLIHVLCILHYTYSEYTIVTYFISLFSYPQPSHSKV